MDELLNNAVESKIYRVTLIKTAGQRKRDSYNINGIRLTLAIVDDKNLFRIHQINSSF